MKVLWGRSNLQTLLEAADKSMFSPRVLRRTNCIPRANGLSCSATDLRGHIPVRVVGRGGNVRLLVHRPERDDDGGGLGAGRDQRDDEEEDEEGDEGAAGAIALPRHGVAVLVQVRLHDDELQLVPALTAGGWRDDLPALDAGAVRVVADLRSDPGWTVNPEVSHLPETKAPGGRVSPRRCR